MKGNVSLNDIASKLGVSKTLVSMVLNNKAKENGISRETQNKVLKLARRFKYKPNLIARGLRMGRTNTIGLVVSDISNPFYSKMARFIEDNLSGKDYHLVICSTDEDTEREKKILRLMQEKQFDGMIISTSQKDPNDFKQFLREEYPFVLIDRKLKNLKTNYVGVDNFQSSYDSVKYLLGKGYRRIGAFAVSPCHISSISDRSKGFIAALSDSGVANPADFLFQISFNDLKNSVEKKMRQLIFEDKKIDALFVFNNNLASTCLEVFKKNNIVIPDEIAFLSFDDIDAFKITNPSITAIDQPLDELCNYAVNILMDQIEKYQKHKKEIILKPSLIIRESA